MRTRSDWAVSFTNCNIKILSNKLKNRFLRIECFGVKIEIETSTYKIYRFVKTRLDDVFPVCWQMTTASSFEHRFCFLEDAGQFSVFKNNLEIGVAGSLEKGFGILESNLRLTAAEFTKQVVFLHAGVVGWEGKALIIPGKSFSGKTTLVAEFVKRGFLYLSDEYAVIDKQGLIHPFPKKLSVRGIIDDFTQMDFDVEQLGGKRGVEPLPAGFLLVTEYRRNAFVAQLSEASAGAGMMACLANSISIRQQPQLVLEVIDSMLARCRIFQNERGAARAFVDLFMEFTGKS